MASIDEKKDGMHHHTGSARGASQDGRRSPSMAVSAQDDDLTWTPEEERKLVTKMDIRIIPCVFVMYLLSYLDRSNIGNAYTAGMGRDLSMTDNDYSIVLLVFFITYVTFEVPSNMLLTRLRPSKYLPGIMFAWGGLSMCFAAIKTWQAAAGLRVILGAMEASFSPGVIFLLSSWYRPGELARRFGIYYTAAAISGVFGGLIAGGLLQTLDGKNGIAGWRYLFIVEGAATCAVSAAAIFILPDFPSTTRWLTPRERHIATRRLTLDSLGGTQNGEDVGHWQAFKMAMTDWRTWGFTLSYMCTVGSQTIQYFIPELVKSMGYSGFQVQYMTAPIYACAAVAILIFCFSSDYFRDRAYHLAVACSLSIVPFAVILGVTDNKARYGLLCVGVTGLYASCPLINIWSSNAIPHPGEKRAVAVAFINGMGNLASIYGSFLFPKNSKNQNRTGFGVTLAFMSIAFVMAFVMKWALTKWPYPELQTSNTISMSRRDEEEGQTPTVSKNQTKMTA
ncbi:unnamed protein product [Sympodiomycopsis kandeliae]